MMAKALYCGEFLRAALGQDSFLWFLKPETDPKLCPNSQSPFARKFGLGYGAKANETEQFPTIGHLCKFNMPVTKEGMPFACSIYGNFMWATDNLAYGMAAAEDC